MWRPWEYEPVTVDQAKTNILPVVGRGNPIQSQTAKIVRNLFEYFKDDRKETGTSVMKREGPVTQISKASGISKSSVRQIMKIEDVSAYSTPTKKWIKNTKVAFDKIDSFNAILCK